MREYQTPTAGDGQRSLTGRWLWDPGTGSSSPTSREPTAVLAVTFAPDGERVLAGACEDGDREDVGTCPSAGRGP